MKRSVACTLAAAACFFLFNIDIAAADAPDGLEKAEFPSLISSVRFRDSQFFCGEPVPLGDRDVLERVEKEVLIAMWNRFQTLLWIKRSGRYMPFIESALKENNLPDDLKYMAVIESALRPHVGSSKGAVGFWQFIRPTGLRYGLEINRDIDERRNIFASTRAAIRYLKDLYGEFGSWSLAAAAYNMGEDGLRRAIRRQKTDDYYKLYLSLETQQYLPKIIAVKMILTDPGKYGFHITKDDLYPPVRFDRVEIDFKRETPIQLVAEACGSYFKVIKDLNPEIRGYDLPKKRITLLIPEGASERFHASYDGLVKDWLASARTGKTATKKSLGKDRQVYIVKKGDYLSKIAQKFNVRLSDLLSWNSLRMNSQIHPGDRLVIPGR